MDESTPLLSSGRFDTDRASASESTISCYCLPNEMTSRGASFVTGSTRDLGCRSGAAEVSDYGGCRNDDPTELVRTEAGLLGWNEIVGRRGIQEPWIEGFRRQDTTTTWKREFSIIWRSSVIVISRSRTNVGTTGGHFS